jgi:hypothetical protein
MGDSFDRVTPREEREGLLRTEIDSEISFLLEVCDELCVSCAGAGDAT